MTTTLYALCVCEFPTESNHSVHKKGAGVSDALTTPSIPTIHFTFARYPPLPVSSGSRRPLRSMERRHHEPEPRDSSLWKGNAWVYALGGGPGARDLRKALRLSACRGVAGGAVLVQADHTLVGVTLGDSIEEP